MVMRAMTGFHQDEAGEWVVELDCGHRQHVHDAASDDDQARHDRIGDSVDCPPCDRTELPDGLRPVRTTTTWTNQTVPAALLSSHRVANGVWGLLAVESGRLRFLAETSPPLVRVVDADHPQPIPPAVPHRIELDGEVRFHVTFLEV